MSRSAQLAEILAAMYAIIPELHGGMVAGTDGLALMHDFPDKDAERIAAMAASAVLLGAQISEKAILGELQEAVIRGADRQLVVCPAGTVAVLALSAPLVTNPGLIRHVLHESVAAIRRVLE